MLCKFDNPLKFTNHGAKALGHSIIENAPTQVPLAKRLAHSNHSNLISGIHYQAKNDVAEKMLQDAMIHNTAPISTHQCANMSSAPTPAHSDNITNNTTREHSSTSFTSPISSILQRETTTNSHFNPPNRPIIVNPYKRATNYSQEVLPTPPTQDASFKREIEVLKKEKVRLQVELADTVGESCDQKKQKDEMISILQNEKIGLVKSVETLKAENSPLKRKLADMYDELTVAYSKLAEFKKKMEEEERIRKEKEQQLALEKQIEERIEARMAEWDNVQVMERAVEAKRIAHLEQTIREKEEKDKKCFIM